MIVAELAAGELRRRLTGPGLRVRLGPVAAEIRSPFDAVASGLALLYAKHEVLGAGDFADFRVAVVPPLGVRRFVAPQALFKFDGNTRFRPLPAAQAFPLLEWGLNWCITMHCHQYLIIHSAVLERHGRALLLPAPPGSGKSTLCAALAARGWRLLSDELALIELDGARVVPIPRPISLKNRSIDTIARFWPDAAIGDVVPDTLKGSVAHVRPPADSVQRALEFAVPAWVVLPRYEDGAEMDLAALRKCDAFMRLVDSAFNYSVHGRAGFEALAALVDASDCYAFTYGGALDEAVAAFDRFASS
ncbi:MAG TPA: HprK-related kinase A [Casimicrobiaceae bacterium]